jgi:hypothetical protein
MSAADDAAALAARLSEVATRMYEVENSPDLIFVRSLADTGEAGAAACLTAVAAAWERYATASAAVQELQQAVSGRDRDAATRLLGADVIALPDGSFTSISFAIDELTRVIDDVANAATGLAGPTVAAVGALEQLSGAAAELDRRAKALGAPGEPELAALDHALEHATSTVRTDPPHDNELAAIGRLLGEARRRVDLLERTRTHFPQDVAEAEALLGRLQAAGDDARASLARTREKISGVTVANAAPTAVESLRDRLDDIREQAERGAWIVAFDGLTAWRADAQRELAAAEAHLDATERPLEERNELRGLLDAYHAKAAALGGSEDGDLSTLYRKAHDALFTAPCDLAAAGTFVREYVAAVNAKVGSRR